MTKRFYRYALNYFWFKIELVCYCSKQYSCLVATYFVSAMSRFLFQMSMGLSGSIICNRYVPGSWYLMSTVTPGYFFLETQEPQELLAKSLCWQQASDEEWKFFHYLSIEMYLCQSMAEIFWNIFQIGYLVNPQISALNMQIWTP